MEKNRSLIVGGNGQDGRILQQLLRNFGSQTFVVGRPSDNSEQTIELIRAIEGFAPNRIFALAGFSSVWRSWSNPDLAVLGNLSSLSSLLEAMAIAKSRARVIVASSSEVFDSSQPIVTEESRIKPTNPYGVTKHAAIELAKMYRDVQGMDIRIVHLFNHESPLRSLDFVSQKIASGAAAIKLGRAEKLSLGNIKSSRDWGYAPDFVFAMHLIMELDEPQDFVVGTGKLHTVEELVQVAFEAAGVADWSDRVKSESDQRRVNDHNGSVGDSSKLMKLTGWEPKKFAYDVISEMVLHQIGVLSGTDSPAKWLHRELRFQNYHGTRQG